MKRAINILIVMAILAMLLALVGPIIGVAISYPAPYVNDPLQNPLKVTSVSSNSITLADGRTILIDATSLLYKQGVFQEFDNRVDLKKTADGLFDVYIKTRIGTCGTGRPTLVIPLIPDRFPKYHRYLLGSGRMDTDGIVSNNLVKIALALGWFGGDGDGHWPDKLSELSQLHETVEHRADPGTIHFDANSNYFVCPGTGAIPANISNVDEWTDYIYVGHSRSDWPQVPTLISPPENHRGKYGYVILPGQGVEQLPATEVRALIDAPWLLSGDYDIEKIKRDIVVNIPPRLRPYYTNVNNWIRPASH